MPKPLNPYVQGLLDTLPFLHRSFTFFSHDEVSICKHRLARIVSSHIRTTNGNLRSGVAQSSSHFTTSLYDSATRMKTPC
ncbi:hypothetical protein Y032_0090g2408 [Ancylostoma ceylanicum]|uniref:Uncharacterized protein n=1 Tax=Ancylostoma ceylanicum TaxID=53326 RepID=A0A016TMY3_9BILA|nr:hypothetical protein Y032_0090g2408 [Ancylostoma ceylanicum]